MCMLAILNHLRLALRSVLSVWAKKRYGILPSQELPLETN